MSIACAYTTGCTNVEACNYDIDAQLDDGSCYTAFEAHGINRDCDGNCIDSMTEDACGVCGGVAECCPDQGDVYDCAMVCNGNTVVDECGNCGGDGFAANCVGNDSCIDMDCAGNCDGLAYVDQCQVCTTDQNGTAFFCCDGTYVCDSSTCFPESPHLSPTGLDDCEVCMGDGLSCDASILISDWKMWSSQTSPPITFEYGGSNVALINCPMPLFCDEVNIDTEHQMHLDITINASGTGFDLGTDGDPDLDIELTFGIYINRIVEIGAVESTCDDIYGSVSNPEEVEVTFDASNAPNGVFNFEDITLPENIDLFQDVVINGTTYTLDRTQDFNAVYQMRIYITEYNVIGYDYDTENIVVNDIDNQIEATLVIHHDPYPEACPGLPGDVTQPIGVVDCNDYNLASLWLSDDSCENYQNNPSAPDRCCNVAMLHYPTSQFDQNDLDYLLATLAASGEFCQEP